MDIYDRIEYLLNKHGISSYKLAKETGISTGLISQWKKRTQNPSQAKLLIIANYFGVSLDYLTGNEGTEKAPTLTDKDERDIARDVERIMSNLETSGDLMFDGVPMSQEAKESMAAAMKLGLEAARLKNKETYTHQKRRQK